MSRLAAVLTALAPIAGPAAAQDGNPTTPGALANPGSYQGSMALQQQEQHQYQQQQQQNQQMQQRLDQTYRQYAPGRGGGGGGPGGGQGVDLWKKPPLAPAQNPLLGRWRQIASRGVSEQNMGGLDALLGGSGSAASLVNGALAGGCKSMFGTGMIAFTPTSLDWVAADGHQEVLNHVEYRANGGEVVVLTRDPGAVPALIFGLPDHDHAVVAFFKCTMERLGAQPQGAQPQGARASAALPKGPTGGAPAAAPSGSANAILRFNVGAAAPGAFTPFVGQQIWVTPEDPAAALGGSPVVRLTTDCANVQACTSDLRLMTGKALGSVRTDAQGRAQTPPIAAGRYFLVGIFPYQGHVLLWNVAVDLRAGSNDVTLGPSNGRAVR
ncbi:hypothetical protein [Phenylobacterium sp.]|uniref:hypothetical protein n=1 Tax=Phenylobacterium sp. TaxID=1871053 RepID=UPI002E2F2AB6|nr:hypothetical protein [Phenylobacterium sp.]HEX3366234.1 hypothetical protein [Phenylobacterium sp.]